MSDALELPAPGIYFGMPEADYHAAPAFSTSGIKHILVSPLDFWSRSWLNTDRPEDKDSTAKLLGSAYHKAILEGVDAFEATYAVKPEPEEFPGVLKSGDDLKAECKARGLKASGTIAEVGERIRQDQAERGEDPDAIPLWSEIMDRFEVETAGKIHLTRAQWMEIRKAAFVMSRMPSVRKAFTGGRAEVSIFWTQDGVPMKARIDYLKPGIILDLKSFGNIMSKEIMSAVAGEVARNRYYIQPVVYTAALKAAREMFAADGMKVVHGDIDPAWLKPVMTAPKSRFVFVFQQTGDVPNVIAREFAQFETFGGQGASPNGYWQMGEMAMREGLHRFRQCMATFGPDTPWIVDHPVKAFVDVDFPAWMLDAVQQIGEAA